MKSCIITYKQTCLVLVCCVLISIVLHQIPKNKGLTHILTPDWLYNNNCYFMNISDKLIEQWSIDIFNSVKLYGVSVFSGHEDDDINGKINYNYFRNNIRKVLQYPVNQKTDNLVLSSADRTRSPKCESVSNEIPVIVTAGSTRFIPRFRNLFRSIEKSLLPFYKNVKIIFYDLGMSHTALEELKNMCLQCEIRLFPFHMFPPYCKDDLKNYIWKPLIIHKALQEFDFVMWVDSSVEFRGGRKVFDDIFSRAKTVGVQLVSLDNIPKELGPISYMTKAETFRFLNESLEDFVKFPEVEANRLIFKRTPFIMNAIIRPWVGCALTENCMGDKHTKIVISCDRWVGPIPLRFILKSLLGYDSCHRFDQSVLSIILTRIFGKYRHVVHTKYIKEWVVNKVDI